ncbi:MAG TPA: sigma-54 dependent transcriptional regulator [Polyangiaceae bacterium]|nr:sigma-54 dependent transcriptional regulator [Polyangiaceae bacterium]
MSARILVVEDDDETREAVVGSLEDLGYEVLASAEARSAKLALDEREFDVLVTDIRMPGITGLELCAEIAGNHPDLPVILMTAFGDSRAVVQGMRAGATDFLPKPFSLEDLKVAVERALERREGSERMIRLPEAVASEEVTIAGMIGSSPAMREVARRVRQVAGHQAPVLITGETGTGKELVAHAIHQLSQRCDGPFVALNCAAIPTEMIESELFGHAQGAFTGAVRSRPGVFRAADRGTLFLDEIGAMPVSLQARLLRAIEQRAIRAVGTVEEVFVDVRVAAATNSRLREIAATGQFRPDLLFRLSTFEIELPPLRARDNDIEELARYFLDKLSPAQKHVLAPETLVALRTYPWPGNVRELENCIHAAMAISDGGVIEVGDLPARIRSASHGAEVAPDLVSVELDSVERRHIERVLRETGGNRSEAARKLGIDRVTLYRKIKRYRVD